MNAISCPFSSRRCKTSASSLKQPSAFNPSGTSFSTSLQCVSATRTTHFVYATCYLCLGHVCYLCLGLGPSRKTQGYNRVEDDSTLDHDIRSKNVPSRWSIMSLGRGGDISGDRLGATTGLLFLDGGETR